MAKKQKERREREKALKEAGIDTSKVNLDEQSVDENVDLDAKMKYRLNRKNGMKSYIIYPDGRFKENWEKLMSLYANIFNLSLIFSRLVITTCIFTPYAMAFIPDFSIQMNILDNFMNLLFFSDIFIIFFSAYTDEDFNLVDDYRVRILQI